MRLTITTPLAIVVDVDGIDHLRGEDETGAFGILSGHADFLTVLAISVISWRDARGVEHHAAVRGGMLEVRGGSAITVATREAIADDDLGHLETEVLAAYRRGIEAERIARTDAHRLYLAAIRQIYQIVKPQRSVGLGAVRAKQLDDFES